jgi:hypothetical protein
MKLVIEIGGQKYALPVDAAERLIAALAEGEWLEHKYVGKDVSPTNYIDLLTPIPSMHDTLKFGAMDEDTYGALKLTTKLFRDNADK